MAKHLLFVFLALVLTGCTEVDMSLYDNPDYDGGIDYHPEQWGQRRVVKATELQENQAVVVVQNDGSPGEAPHVRTFLLDCKPQGTPSSANNIIRWQITIGVGGGQTTFYIDAVGVQQVSVPSGKVTISLIAQPAIIGDTEAVSPFEAPDVSYSVFAGIAIGNTSTNPSTYTISIGLSTGNDIDIPLPAGATGFRWTGVAAQKTYDANVLVTAEFSASISTTWSGDKLQTSAYSSDYIPIPGGTKNLSVDNGSGSDLDATIQFCLDL